MRESNHYLSCECCLPDLGSPDTEVASVAVVDSDVAVVEVDLAVDESGLASR